MRQDVSNFQQLFSNTNCLQIILSHLRLNNHLNERHVRNRGWGTVTLMKYATMFTSGVLQPEREREREGERETEPSFH